MKAKIKVHRDEDGRPSVIEMKKGRSKLRAEVVATDLTGHASDFLLEGTRGAMPTMGELLQFFDGKHIARIGTLELIDLITRIALIDEITTIGTIEEISSMQDVIHTPAEFLINLDFEQNFIGWHLYGGTVLPVISTSKAKYGGKSCYFAQGGDVSPYIRQFLPIPFGVDWGTLMCFVQATATGSAIYMTYYYTDGTTSSETLGIAAADTWERETLSPTAGKHIEAIQFEHFKTYTNSCYLDNIMMVF